MVKVEHDAVNQAGLGDDGDDLHFGAAITYIAAGRFDAKGRLGHPVTAMSLIWRAFQDYASPWSGGGAETRTDSQVLSNQ